MSRHFGLSTSRRHREGAVTAADAAKAAGDFADDFNVYSVEASAREPLCLPYGSFPLRFSYLYTQVE